MPTSGYTFLGNLDVMGSVFFLPFGSTKKMFSVTRIARYLTVTELTLSEVNAATDHCIFYGPCRPKIRDYITVFETATVIRVVSKRT